MHLLTQDEASGYIGTKLGPGKLENVTPLMVCTWAKGTTKLKIFLAPPTDPVAAKAYYEANKSRVPEGGVISELPNFFDGALIASGKTPSGHSTGSSSSTRTNSSSCTASFPHATARSSWMGQTSSPDDWT